jgi:hypothetical protein
LAEKFKRFHFQELDWVISFPEKGNQGRKYLYYTVTFENRNKGNFEVQSCLADVFENPEFEKSFPYTVGFFKESKGTSNEDPFYLEMRIIQSIEEFWKFLNDLDI